MPENTADGRTVVVTGGGRGIGRSVALGLGATGWRVLVVDLGCAPDGTGTDPVPAEGTADEIVSAGGIAMAAAVDVTSLDEVRAAIDRASEAWGSMDAAVNVAGVLRLGDIHTTTDEDWDLILGVNLRGALNVNRTVVQRWTDTDASFGRLLNFTSAAGLEGHPQMLAYSSAKAGLIGMTLSLANSLPAAGFTANAVAPSAATRMAMTGMGMKGTEEELETAARERLAPLDIDPDGVVPLVAYLLSDDAEHITGQVLSNHGWSYSMLSHPEAVATIPTSSRDLADVVVQLHDGLSAVRPEVARWGARAETE